MKNANNMWLNRSIDRIFPEYSLLGQRTLLLWLSIHPSIHPYARGLKSNEVPGFRIGKNQVNIATSDHVSYQCLPQFIHTCASVIYPQTDFTSNTLYYWYQMNSEQWYLNVGVRKTINTAGTRKAVATNNFAHFVIRSTLVQWLTASVASIT